MKQRGRPRRSSMPAVSHAQRKLSATNTSAIIDYIEDPESQYSLSEFSRIQLADHQASEVIRAKNTAYESSFGPTSFAQQHQFNLDDDIDVNNDEDLDDDEDNDADTSGDDATAHETSPEHHYVGASSNRKRAFSFSSTTSATTNTPTVSTNNGQQACGDKRTATKICRVCGDKAYSYNFNVITCESCKAFFRRNANKDKEIRCPFNEKCDINIVSRRFCQRCRLQKCFRVGMKKEWIMSEEARLEKKQRILDNRERRLAEQRQQEQQIENVSTEDQFQQQQLPTGLGILSAAAENAILGVQPAPPQIPNIPPLDQPAAAALFAQAPTAQIVAVAQACAMQQAVVNQVVAAAALQQQQQHQHQQQHQQPSVPPPAQIAPSTLLTQTLTGGSGSNTVGEIAAPLTTTLTNTSTTAASLSQQQQQPMLVDGLENGVGEQSVATAIITTNGPEGNTLSALSPLSLFAAASAQPTLAATTTAAIIAAASANNPNMGSIESPPHQQQGQSLPIGISATNFQQPSQQLHQNPQAQPMITQTEAASAIDHFVAAIGAASTAQHQQQQQQQQQIVAQLHIEQQQQQQLAIQQQVVNAAASAFQHQAQQIAAQQQAQQIVAAAAQSQQIANDLQDAIFHQRVHQQQQQQQAIKQELAAAVAAAVLSKPQQQQSVMGMGNSTALSHPADLSSSVALATAPPPSLPFIEHQQVATASLAQQQQGNVLAAIPQLAPSAAAAPPPSLLTMTPSSLLSLNSTTTGQQQQTTSLQNPAFLAASAVGITSHLTQSSHHPQHSVPPQQPPLAPQQMGNMHTQSGHQQEMVAVPKDVLLKLVEQKIENEQQQQQAQHPPLKCQCHCQCGRYPSEILIVDKVMTDLLEGSSKQLGANNGTSSNGSQPNSVGPAPSTVSSIHNGGSATSFNNFTQSQQTPEAMDVGGDQKSDPGLTVLDQEVLSELAKANEIWKSEGGDGHYPEIGVTEAGLRRLIKTVSSISQFRMLDRHDQIQILRRGCEGFFVLRGGIAFNETNLPYLQQMGISDKITSFYSEFPQEWASNETVNLVLCLILLYNAEVADLRNPISMAVENMKYQSLLKRLLYTLCARDSARAGLAAAELLARVDQIRQLFGSNITGLGGGYSVAIDPIVHQVLNYEPQTMVSG